MIRDVMEDQPVEHHVEGTVGKSEPPGVADVGLVGAGGLDHSSDSLGVSIDRHDPKVGRWKEVAPWVPPAADGQNLARREAQALCEELPLATHGMPVMKLERLLATEPVEQVARVVGLAPECARRFGGDAGGV